MEEITLSLTAMANGGAALGRDENDRVTFVPLGIPGEFVRVEIVDGRRRYARARLLEVLQPAPDRIEPQCSHFGVCGGCHFQHIAYAAQLDLKQAIVSDQLERIGGLTGVLVRPTLPNPEPWAYAIDVSFSRTSEGRLGFWSPELGKVMPIESCQIIHPRLLELYFDLDLDLPGLTKLTLRIGQDGSLLAALQLEDDVPPALEADFPVSVALVMPDGSAINLVGDNHLYATVKERDFRFSAGSYFPASPAAAGGLIDAVVAYAALTGAESVLELYSGVGTLTAFLAPAAAEVVGIEMNPDAVGDAAVNLEEFENVTLYEGLVEELLPLLELSPQLAPPQLALVDPPPAGLPRQVTQALSRLTPRRIIYVSYDVATLARDGRQLAESGYDLVEVQPIDMLPQTSQIQTVSLWTYHG